MRLCLTQMEQLALTKGPVERRLMRMRHKSQGLFSSSNNDKVTFHKGSCHCIRITPMCTVCYVFSVQKQLRSNYHSYQMPLHSLNTITIFHTSSMVTVKMLNTVMMIMVLN
jgi:hypothetical protein